MPVSLAGLDMSWLNDPANRLPPREEKPRTNWHAKRSDAVGAPFFMSDISPFVSVATRNSEEITSRSQLREYEKRTGLVQVGDAFEGKISAENDAQRAKWKALAEGHTTAPEWVSD
jgi:hypothetical protein